MSSLAERVWSTLQDREHERCGIKGIEPMGIVDLENRADDQMTLLTEWLANQAELLYFGDNR